MQRNFFVLRYVTRGVAIALIAGGMSACQAPPARVPAPSSLELIGAEAIEVPDTCKATGSVIVDFTVLQSGQTTSIAPVAGPECLQHALTAWVASFRYAPVTSETRTSVEWLMVEARKGS
ncbi:MAG TPA: hypothetical protein VIT67_12185 [Povalibacter sp.]